MNVPTHTVFGQASWRLETPDVEAFVTETGGHLGPVTFHRRRDPVQPYAIAPWAEEPAAAALPPVLRALRGDFFCLPFGGNTTLYRGERHPIHGETANARWQLEAMESQPDSASLHLSLKTKVRRGRVDKWVRLVGHHQAVYCQHVVSGMRGLMCCGHHAMLKFPDRPGSGLVTTSRFALGQVFVEPTERPEDRGYSSLKPGAEFRRLDQVATVTGELADLSRYPARRGYEDIVMLVSDPSLELAWTAVTFPREHYAWFALKDPRVLRGALLWHSNGGRHYFPWNGRHVNVLGLEEVTSYFHYGLAESAHRNPLSARGHATCLRLGAAPLVVNYIMGVVKIPPGFDRVVQIAAARGQNAIVLRAASGKKLERPLDVGFLRQPAMR